MNKILAAALLGMSVVLIYALRQWYTQAPRERA